MTRQLRRHERCLNCDAPVPGNFCGECGQENTDYHVSLRQLLGDVADELLQLESRLWRSLWDLWRRPGQLTLAYASGQRVRYTTPLRLYLVAVGLYFGLAALMPYRPSHIKIDITDEREPAAAVKPREPPSAFEQRIEDRLGIVDGKKQDADEVGRRARPFLESATPKAIALLVPIFALLTLALFRRPRRFYVEHLVFALHVHALALLLAVVPMLARSDAGILLSLVVAWIWTVLALRAVFAQSWLRTVVKAAVLGFVYGVLVAVGISGAFLASIWFS
jgi:hypothetical protein